MSPSIALHLILWDTVCLCIWSSLIQVISQPAPGVLQSPTSQHWDYRCETILVFLFDFWRFKVSFSCLCEEPFVDQTSLLAIFYQVRLASLSVTNVQANKVPWFFFIVDHHKWHLAKYSTATWVCKILSWCFCFGKNTGLFRWRSWNIPTCLDNVFLFLRKNSKKMGGNEHQIPFHNNWRAKTPPPPYYMRKNLRYVIVTWSPLRQCPIILCSKERHGIKHKHKLSMLMFQPQHMATGMLAEGSSVDGELTRSFTSNLSWICEYSNHVLFYGNKIMKAIISDREQNHSAT